MAPVRQINFIVIGINVRLSDVVEKEPGVNAMVEFRIKTGVRQIDSVDEEITTVFRSESVQS
jgi:hypothetical protein